MRWNEIAKPRRSELGRLSAKQLIANMREDLEKLEAVFGGEEKPVNGITYTSDLKNHSMALRRRALILQEQGSQPFGDVVEMSIITGVGIDGTELTIAKLTDDSRKREGRFARVADRQGKIITVETNSFTAKEARSLFQEDTEFKTKSGKDVRIVAEVA